MAADNYPCEIEQIAAYIDGDLDDVARASLEQHLLQCKGCDSELRTQRLFMCELEATLTSPLDQPVPRNFAQIVAAHAASDMRGVRDRSEHKRALRFSVVLAIAAFALLGAAASKAVIFSVSSMGGKVLGVLELIGKTLFDAVLGVSVILRFLTHGLLPESDFAARLLILFVTFAVVLLSLLISRYHRQNRIGLTR